MNDLIQRAEQASTADEAVAVFMEAPVDPEKALYWQHTYWAQDDGDDTRALGYLLLAAMAVKPTGWRYEIEEICNVCVRARLEPYRNGPAKDLDPVVAESATIDLACCALLAAILKAGQS